MKAEITKQISRKANRHIARIMGTLSIACAAGAVGEETKQSVKKELWDMFDDLVETIGPLLEKNNG